MPSRNASVAASISLARRTSSSLPSVGISAMSRKYETSAPRSLERVDSLDVLSALRVDAHAADRAGVLHGRAVGLGAELVVGRDLAPRRPSLRLDRVVLVRFHLVSSHGGESHPGGPASSADRTLRSAPRVQAADMLCRFPSVHGGSRRPGPARPTRSAAAAPRRPPVTPHDRRELSQAWCRSGRSFGSLVRRIASGNLRLMTQRLSDSTAGRVGLHAPDPPTRGQRIPFPTRCQAFSWRLLRVWAGSKAGGYPRGDS